MTPCPCLIVVRSTDCQGKVFCSADQVEVTCVPKNQCLDATEICDGIQTEGCDDELNCQNYTCLDGYVKCADGKTCVEVSDINLSKHTFLQILTGALYLSQAFIHKYFSAYRQPMCVTGAPFSALTIQINSAKLLVLTQVSMEGTY